MYYPKSQITPNLYTNGGEYKVLKTDKVYMGYYYSLSNGNSFVGKSPTSEKIQQLLVPIKKQKKSPTSPLLPKVIKLNPLLSKQGYSNNINERYIPKPSSTPPTPIDYNRGVISRFFCKKNNENLYFEINKKTFIDLRNNSPIVAFELYTPILINWSLTGNIEQVFFNNKTEVSNIEQSQNLFGLSLYFKNNFSQYYLES
mgnify:CR=1 FL=1|tara:strand:+ start:2341 stop:2940 length:600 start_codon:yes stop_codon:yes gene_type:complete